MCNHIYSIWISFKLLTFNLLIKAHHLTFTALNSLTSFVSDAGNEHLSFLEGFTDANIYNVIVNNEKHFELI